MGKDGERTELGWDNWKGKGEKGREEEMQWWGITETDRHNFLYDNMQKM